MKNWFISGLMVGALACPVVYAHSDNAAEQSNANQMQEENAKMDHKKHGKKKKCHAKKKKHHANKHAHKNHSKKVAAEAEGETSAEKKIDEETELTNR